MSAGLLERAAQDPQGGMLLHRVLRGDWSAAPLLRAFLEEMGAQRL